MPSKYTSTDKSYLTLHQGARTTIICARTSTTLVAFTDFLNACASFKAPTFTILASFKVWTKVFFKHLRSLFKESLALFKALHFFSLDYFMEWSKVQTSTSNAPLHTQHHSLVCKPYKQWNDQSHLLN